MLIFFRGTREQVLPREGLLYDMSLKKLCSQWNGLAEVIMSPHHGGGGGTYCF